MSKFIFITGGVSSSLGKGLTAASLGFLLGNRGLKVAMQKLDPYINVAPGRMDPRLNGEVYVTDDGTEGNLDLGHYERISGISLNRRSSVTTGLIYQDVIARELRGEYGGRAVQVIPHITDAIKDAFKSREGPDTDVVLVELGGTVGDIEGLPYIEAFRQFSLERDDPDVMFIHLTLVPFLKSSREIKTKPTQHSVQKLREYGIQPDVIVCRTEQPMPADVKKKIAMFCNVRCDWVVEEKNVDCSVYEVPMMLHEQGLDEIICKRLSIAAVKPDLSAWAAMLAAAANPGAETEVALVASCRDAPDSCKSVFEALFHGGTANRARVRTRQVSGLELEAEGPDKLLAGVGGVIAAGGPGLDGAEGIISAIGWARKNRVPFLGLGTGMELAAVELCRNVCGMKKAFHGGLCDKQENFDSANAAVARLDGERCPNASDGVFRKGLYACALRRGTVIREAYGGEEIVRERHHNEYEISPAAAKALDAFNMPPSGVNPDSQFVEAIEVPGHPWFVGVIFHPEFRSRPLSPHPLFKAFVKAALDVCRRA